MWFWLRKNAEIIHQLEENQIKPSKDTNEEYTKEAIKCHHNDIANYINDNFKNENSNVFLEERKITS